VAPWAGWGAGPAGAGSTGGPSRAFLGIAAVASVVVAVLLARDANWLGAGLSGAAAIYFGMRAAGRIGRGRSGK
jgi:hypothetical protein